MSLQRHDPPPPTQGNPPSAPPHALTPNQQQAPPPPPGAVDPTRERLADANERTWCQIGTVAETMGAMDKALSAYEHALRHNPASVLGLCACANILRIKEKYSSAVEFYQRALSVAPDNGDIWSSLGHCYLMQDQLQKAYSAYQQALYYLPNPKEDPKLWYGIGILYDRYGSLEHAEEAFHSVLNMNKEKEKPFEKSNEILFRLGIIYKQQGHYQRSLNCFNDILRVPPAPLAQIDIWFQIGHVWEQLGDYDRAKDAYERVVIDAPNHAKVLQQLGWLYNLPAASFHNNELAVQYLTKSLESDATDAQSWYLLGRAYMSGAKYSKAYEAYQQAVYRDGRNPTFWCSIGVLYFQINQFRDALDAYSRAIRINPYISEVWFDLGSLYESCNNQVADAIDAYERANELDPSNPAITQRLQLLKTAQKKGTPLPAPPPPKDVHPTAYASGPPSKAAAGGQQAAAAQAPMSASGVPLFNIQNNAPAGTPGSLAMFASGLNGRGGVGAAGAGAGAGAGGSGSGASAGVGAVQVGGSGDGAGPPTAAPQMRGSPTFVDERDRGDRGRVQRLLDDRERDRGRSERSDRTAVEDTFPSSRGGPSGASANQPRWAERDMSPPGPPPARRGSPFGTPQPVQGYGAPPPGSAGRAAQQSPRYRYDEPPPSAGGWGERRSNGHGHHHPSSSQAGQTPQQQQFPSRLAGGRDILDSGPSTREVRDRERELRERERERERGDRPELPRSASSTLASSYASPPPPPAQSVPGSGYASYDRSPALVGRDGRDRDSSLVRGEGRSPEQRRRPSDERDRMQVDRDPREERSRDREGWNGPSGSSSVWEREQQQQQRDRDRYAQPAPVQSRPRYDPRMDGPSPPPLQSQQQQQQPRSRFEQAQEYGYDRERGGGSGSPRTGEKRRRPDDAGPPASVGTSAGARQHRTSSINGGPMTTPVAKDKMDTSSPRSDRAPSTVPPPPSAVSRKPPSSGPINGHTRSPTAATNGNGRSPTSATQPPASRTIDENYDEGGVADALMGLASFRTRAPQQSQPNPSSNFGSANQQQQQQQQPSTRSGSPTANGQGVKRPLSPSGSSGGSDTKRPRITSGAASGGGGSEGPDTGLPPIATLSPTSPASTSGGDVEDRDREELPRKASGSAPASAASGRGPSPPGGPVRRAASPARSVASRASGGGSGSVPPRDRASPARGD